MVRISVNNNTLLISMLDFCICYILTFTYSNLRTIFIIIIEPEEGFQNHKNVKFLLLAISFSIDFAIDGVSVGDLYNCLDAIVQKSEPHLK